jgi:D-sedoheptulose 7-phosphate isomerase
MAEEIIQKCLKESLRVKERFFTKKNTALLLSAAEFVSECFKSGGKLLVIGNGGSAADAQHVAAEFVNRFEIERPPLPAIALTTDTSVLTSIANDYSFDAVFVKQLKALAREGDVLLAISTSGTSPNVVQAVGTAAKIGMKTIGLVGRGGGDIADRADIVLNVDSNSTPRVQEVHVTVCHMLCELVDYMLFQRVEK